MRYTLIVLLLAGCTTWEQAGKDSNDYQRDMYACQRDAAAERGVGGGIMVANCMQSKGWRAK